MEVSCRELQEVTTIGITNDFVNAYNMFLNRVFTQGGRLLPLDNNVVQSLANIGIMLGNNDYADTAWYANVACLNTLCLVYAYTNEGLKCELYTANSQVLDAMVQYGLISQDSALRRAYSTLSRVEIGTQVVGVRFDFVSCLDGKPIFKVVSPNTFYSFSDCMIVPAYCGWYAYAYLKAMIGDNAVQIASSDDKHYRMRICCFSPNVLVNVYGEEVTRRKVAYCITGFNFADGRIYAYDLQGSATSVKSTDFNMVTFSDVSPYDIGALDRSLLNMDDDLVRLYYRKQLANEFSLTNLRKQLMSLLKTLRIDTGSNEFCRASREAQFDIVMRVSSRYNAYDLVQIMYNFPSIFGTSEDIKRGVSGVTGYTGESILTTKNSEHVDFSNLPLDVAVKLFRDYASKGILNIVYYSKTHGTMTSCNVTNSAAVLRQIYGDDYVAKYESNNTKLAVAKRGLQGCDGSVNAVLTILRNTGVDVLLSENNLQGAMYDSTGSLNVANILACIEMLSAQAASKSQRSRNPYTVTVRSLTDKYLKTLDIRGIRDCTFNEV